ncbi:MAG: hypothetical protein ACTTIC_04950 [Helicobacteraceae bacterium]
MDFLELKRLLTLAHKAGLSAQVTGKEGTGKTHFCKEIFQDAVVILAYELNVNNLIFLKSVFETGKTVIFENLTEQELPFIAPIITNKVLYGKPLSNFFIVTSRFRLELAKTFYINFTNQGSVAWLKWASANGINKLVIKAIENKDLLKEHKPRDLESLSKILGAGVAPDLLETVLRTFLQDDYESIELIKKEYAKDPPLPAGAPNASAMPAGAVTSGAPLQDPLAAPAPAPTLSQDAGAKKLAGLTTMLDNQDAESKLLDALKDKKIQDLIDLELSKIV